MNYALFTIYLNLNFLKLCGFVIRETKSTRYKVEEKQKMMYFIVNINVFKLCEKLKYKQNIV